MNLVEKVWLQSHYQLTITNILWIGFLFKTKQKKTQKHYLFYTTTANQNRVVAYFSQFAFLISSTSQAFPRPVEIEADVCPTFASNCSLLTDNVGDI